MEQLNAFVPELEKLRAELEEAFGRGGIPAGLGARLGALTEKMKAAAEQSMAGLKTKAEALAKQCHAQAAAIEKKKEEAKNPPPPPPHPWEDHQGLEDATIEGLVAHLMKLAETPD